MFSSMEVEVVSLAVYFLYTKRGPNSREGGTAPPSFRPMSIVATVAHLSYCWALVNLIMVDANFRICEIIYKLETVSVAEPLQNR